MRKPKVSARRREKLLEEFEQSGLSVAAFARLHGVKYTTFCGWRKRCSKPKRQRKPRLVKVEVEVPKVASVEIQIGRLTRLRITDGEQARLAACLVRELEGASC